MISFGSFCSFLGDLPLEESLSTSISVETDLVKGTCSLSSATRNDLAAGLVDGYVSAMTCARISGVRRLRREEMDRRARRENLASNNVTAFSSNGKLLLISAIHLKSALQKNGDMRCLRTSNSLSNRINLHSSILLTIHLSMSIHHHITICIFRRRSR